MKSKIKEFPKRILIFLILFLALIALGTFGFKFLKNISFSEAFSRTFETLAFMFESETGLVKALEIFLAIFGVMLIWWIFWSFFDLLISGNLTKYLKTEMFLSKMKKMKSHYIIAGGGRVGEDIAKKFIQDKKAYIIIEKDNNKIEKLKSKGFLVLKGDVTDSDEDILKKAGLEKAKALILALPETEKNLLVTLIAKEIKPSIDIYARADNPAFVSKLKKAGAKTVIVPEIAAAEKIFKDLFS